jgi:glycosyltransferase involved in cell wall biosynthesis
LLWLLRNKHFDIVHSNTSVIDTGAYLSYFKKIPHIWHLREFGKKDFSLESCLGNRYEKWIYSKCWKFIAISKAVKNEYKSIIPESKISLIYNGILPPNHQYIANHSSSKIQFCIVGRIENNKNQLEALKACKLLKDEGYKNFHLTIIGPSDNVYSKSLIKYIDDNELNEFVHMTGEIFNVSEVLSKMDVGLMLSNNEAFGRVTVEYMMHNLAVIASNTGANSELIANNETGLLYSPGNHIELKNKMKFIINNKKAMLNLAIKGKKEAIVRYNSKINTNCVYELYCEAMNKFNKR